MKQNEGFISFHTIWRYWQNFSNKNVTDVTLGIITDTV